MAEMAERKERKWAMGWGGYVEEMKKGCLIAAPMVAVTVLQYLLQVVSVVMVGHLGQLSLSSVAIATSLTNVTGFRLLSLILPMLLSAFFILCFRGPVCWTLVFKLDLGDLGAAIAFSLSTWLNAILLGIYVMYSSTCEKTRSPLSKDAFLGVPEFFRLGVPSAIMVCLTISTLHFTIPYGFGVATSTRVSNELGAGNP
ncbi:hypothetical protein CRYUN_Cryun39dG0036400 [Craigia yunnanensis]